MPKIPPPPSRRLTQRFNSVLGAVMDILDEFHLHRAKNGVPLDRTRREEIVRLLDTAEAAVARELGMGWRIHWTDDQMVLQRHARVALQMALAALLMVIRREQDRAPAAVAPNRKPRRRVEPFVSFPPGSRDGEAPTSPPPLPLEGFAAGRRPNHPSGVI